MATLIVRRRADEHVLARYTHLLTDVPAQYLERIFEHAASDDCAARLADPLIVELTCNFMRFTVEPFAAPLRTLLEQLAQNVQDALQLERRLHACVHSRDLTLLGQLTCALEEDLRAILATQLVPELEALGDDWRARLGHFTNSVCRRSQHAQTRVTAVLHEWESAVMPEFPYMESVLCGDVDVFDMASIGIAPLTAIALNAHSASPRSSKKQSHAERSLLWFAVSAPSTIAERAEASSQSLFVLFLDECRASKSPDQQLHLSALSARTAVELLRVDTEELLHLHKKFVRASGARDDDSKRLREMRLELCNGTLLHIDGSGGELLLVYEESVASRVHRKASEAQLEVELLVLRFDLPPPHAGVKPQRPQLQICSRIAHAQLMAPRHVQLRNARSLVARVNGVDDTGCRTLLVFAGSRSLSDCRFGYERRELALTKVTSLVDAVVGASYNSMLALLGVSFVGFQVMLFRVRAESDELEPVHTLDTPFEMNLVGLSNELLLLSDSRVAHDAIDVYDVQGARFNVSLEPDALAAGASDTLNTTFFSGSSSSRQSTARESGFYSSSPQTARVDPMQLDSFSIKSATLDRRRSTLRSAPAVAAAAANVVAAEVSAAAPPTGPFLVHLEASRGSLFVSRRGATSITQFRLFVRQRQLL